MADDRLFRVIVLGGMALIGAPPTAGCTPVDAPGEGTQVPQSQTVVVPAGSAPVAAEQTPPPPREGPPVPPPPHLPPVVSSAVADAGAPPPPVDAGTDSGPHLKPPREGPPPRPRLGF
jgi:hypothetical protein